ncbi:MAG: response regulator [Chloroflexi bacterium]|nr:response regulator [Chloroflexota bacterium]
MAKKILIVEDEENILELLSAIFGDHYGVSCARDGEEGLRMAREDSPDIVLLDVRLPKVNGYEVCRQVKSDPSTSHAKVLMLSGMVQNADLREAEEAGADGYVAKPFSPMELVKRVEGLLGNNRRD